MENAPMSVQSQNLYYTKKALCANYQFFVCNHKEFAYDYRQKIDNVAQLQIIDNKKKDYRKKSVISVCNVDYRHKRSGPRVVTTDI